MNSSRQKTEILWGSLSSMLWVFRNLASYRLLLDLFDRSSGFHFTCRRAVLASTYILTKRCKIHFSCLLSTLQPITLSRLSAFSVGILSARGDIFSLKMTIWETWWLPEISENGNVEEVDKILSREKVEYPMRSAGLHDLEFLLCLIRVLISSKRDFF